MQNSPCGRPGIFQTPPRHSRALLSLTLPSRRTQLKFVVGWRDPLDLAFSLWSFLATLGQEGKRVEHRMSRALEMLTNCDGMLAAEPLRLLTASPEQLQSYRLCLDERPRSRHHFYIYGGLYALHLLSWLNFGFKGNQFLFVRMKSLPRSTDQARALQVALAEFLGLQPPPPAELEKRPSICLGATMTTRKQHRIKVHNATVSEVKRQFYASPTGAAVRRFLEPHDAMLQTLIAREGIRVY